MNKLLRLVTGVIQGTKPPCMIVTDLAIYRRLMKIEMRRHTSSGFNQMTIRTQSFRVPDLRPTS
jgi:hypothetical protein